jgi:hypothetical protein
MQMQMSANLSPESPWNHIFEEGEGTKPKAMAASTTLGLQLYSMAYLYSRFVCSPGA